MLKLQQGTGNTYTSGGVVVGEEHQTLRKTISFCGFSLFQLYGDGIYKDVKPKKIGPQNENPIDLLKSTFFLSILLP